MTGHTERYRRRAVSCLDRRTRPKRPRRNRPVRARSRREQDWRPDMMHANLKRKPRAGLVGSINLMTTFKCAGTAGFGREQW